MTPLRVGVIGLGAFGLEHLRHYADLGVEVVAVTDLDPDRSDQARRRGLPVVASVDELLDQQPQAVSVVTGPVGNRELVPVLVDAHIPVLVEKPFASSVADAEHLAELGGAAELVHPGHVLRHDQGCRTMARLVAQGAVGEVLAVDAERHRGTDHHLYRPHHSLASLTMYHDVDLAHWITGASPSILACTTGGADSLLAVTARDDRGAIWTLRASWTLPPPLERERLRVTGTEGAITLEGGEVVLITAAGEYRHQVGGDPLATEIADFCADVEAGEGPSSVTVADAVACVRTVVAIEKGVEP